MIALIFFVVLFLLLVWAAFPCQGKVMSSAAQSHSQLAFEMLPTALSLSLCFNLFSKFRTPFHSRLLFFPPCSLRISKKENKIIKKQILVYLSTIDCIEMRRKQYTRPIQYNNIIRSAGTVLRKRTASRF